LTSEGFGSVEEVAYVNLAELERIEGFDENTAKELQDRALGYIERQNEAFHTKRRELGVEDEVGEVEGVTPQMLVAFGEHGVKTLEDLAGCAVDDLIGWTERKNGEDKREPGILDGLGVRSSEAEGIVIAARRKMGWITDEEPVAADGAST
jgi:N utilization substance protein A